MFCHKKKVWYIRNITFVHVIQFGLSLWLRAQLLTIFWYTHVITLAGSQHSGYSSCWEPQYIIQAVMKPAWDLGPIYISVSKVSRTPVYNTGCKWVRIGSGEALAPSVPGLHQTPCWHVTICIENGVFCPQESFQISGVLETLRAQLKLRARDRDRKRAQVYFLPRA